MTPLSYVRILLLDLTPLHRYAALDYASPFTSEQCPEGIVSIATSTLRIITIEHLGDMFNQSEIPLLHTPRRFLIHPTSNYMITIETDHNACSNVEKEQQASKQDVEEQQLLSLDEQRIFGEPKPGFSHWASCIRILDPVNVRP